MSHKYPFTFQMLPAAKYTAYWQNQLSVENLSKAWIILNKLLVDDPTGESRCHEQRRGDLPVEPRLRQGAKPRFGGNCPCPKVEPHLWVFADCKMYVNTYIHLTQTTSSVIMIETLYSNAESKKVFLNNRLQKQKVYTHCDVEDFVMCDRMRKGTFNGKLPLIE